MKFKPEEIPEVEKDHEIENMEKEKEEQEEKKDENPLTQEV